MGRVESKTRYRFDLQWTTISPVKVGSELESPEFDLPVLKIFSEGSEIPYIPGSSIKGVLRHETVSYLRGIGLKACEYLDFRKSCGGRHRRDIETAQRRKDYEKLSDIISGFCLSCRIFGSPGYRGRTRFGDAYPAVDSSGSPSVSLSSRPGIAIDRLTGAVKDRGLFNAEYISVNSVFKSSIICRGLKKHELALLLKLLSGFDGQHLKIGGLTTKGFGEVGVLIESMSERNLLNSKAESLLPDNRGDAESLQKAIDDWACRTWGEYLESRNLTEYTAQEFSTREERVNRGRHGLSVRGREFTPRNRTDLSQSGLLSYYAIPKKGYSIFVGSGAETYPPESIDDDMQEAIKKCESFERVLLRNKDDPHGSGEPYEVFSQRIRYGETASTAIPGSTLKGVFRSRLEFSLEPQGGIVDACFAVQGRSDRGGSDVHKLIFGFQNCIEGRNQCSDPRFPCVACDMFGMTGKRGSLRGLVEVSDAVLLRGATVAEEIPVAAGRTARLLVVKNKEGEDAPVFDGHVRFRNLSPERLGLLFYAMAHHQDAGLRIGRFHYRDRSSSPLNFGRMLLGIRRLQFDDGRLLEKDELEAFVNKAVELAKQRYHLRTFEYAED